MSKQKKCLHNYQWSKFCKLPGEFSYKSSDLTRGEIFKSKRLWIKLNLCKSIASDTFSEGSQLAWSDLSSFWKINGIMILSFKKLVQILNISHQKWLYIKKVCLWTKFYFYLKINLYVFTN